MKVYFFSLITASTVHVSVCVCVCVSVELKCVGTKRIILMNSFSHLPFFTKQPDNEIPWKERVDRIKLPLCSITKSLE